MQQDQDTETSLEIKTMLECNDKLVTAFSSELTSVSAALLAKGLITADLNSRMLNSARIDKVKASELVEGVRKSIEITPNKKFKDFLEVLQTMDSANQGIANILALKYIELNGTFSAVAVARNHDRREYRYITSQALLLLAVFTSIMALVIILSVQNVFITIIIGTMTMSILIAVVDAIILGQSILDVVIKYWDFIATVLKNTLGNFLPFKCPHCSKWSRMSSYGPGSNVKGPVNCPECHCDIFTF